MFSFVKSGKQSVIGAVAALCGLAMMFGGSAQAQQLGKNCVATIQNRAVQINADGTFAIPNVPVDLGRFRLRVICKMPDGTTRGGQSDFLTLNPNGNNQIPRITLTRMDPLPARLELVAVRRTLSTEGETTQVTTKAISPSGSVKDITPATSGVTYALSNPALASITPDGLVTARKRGNVIVTARFEGLIASLPINMVIPNDADGDIMTDEFERANGFNPNDASDAGQDYDGDGLSNLIEYRTGTNPRAPDTDGDGLADGVEVGAGSNPLNADSDGDGLKDGQEAHLNTNPLNRDTDLDGLSDGDEVALGLDPVTTTATTTVTGRIVDSTGAAVGGASAVVLGRFNSNSGTTGFFTIQNVPATLGPISVLARVVRSGQVLDGVSLEIAAVSGGATDVGAIQIGISSGVVSGLVLNPAGVAVPGANVTVRGTGDTRTTISDLSGRYRVANLLAGAVSVIAADPRTGLRGNATGFLQQGLSTSVDVRLTASGTVAGTVFRRDAVTPVGSGVNVRISGSTVASVVTDAVGNYRFDFVPLGGFNVEAGDDDDNRGRSTGSLTATNQTSVTNIAFLGRGSVSGVVLDGAGAPVPNAAVELNSSSAFPQNRNTTTDANGAYSFTNIFIGNFGVTARSPITRFAGSNNGRVDREADAPVVNVNLAGSGAISGIVTRAGSATAVPGANVLLSPTGMTATTNSLGRYRFDLVPFGSYSIDVNDSTTGDRGLGSAAVAVQDQVTAADISLNGQGRVTVTVRDGANLAVPGAQITLYSQTQFGGSTVGVSQADGTFVFDRVLAGGFYVTAFNPSTQLGGNNTGTVAVGASASITITLQSSGTILGTVFRPAGSLPAIDVVVRLDGNRTVRTNSLGRYRFDIVPTGDHNLEVIDGFNNLRATNGPISITAQGQSITRNMTLVGVSTVTGTVTNPDGTRAPNVALNLRSLSPGFGRDFGGQSDVNGNFTIPQVPVGGFRISATKRDGILQLYGTAVGTVIRDNLNVRADVQLSATLIPVTTTLYDANGFAYNPRESGALEDGTRAVFQGDNANNRGGMVLDVIRGTSSARFVGQTLGVSSLDGRQIEVTQSMGGLEVTRKIYVPRAGYFARYVELINNPGTVAVTVSVRVTNNYRFIAKTQNGFRFNREPRVIATSNGDGTVEVTDPSNPDRWVVIDDDEDGDAFLFDNLPTVAHVFDGTSATQNSDAAAFNLDFTTNYGALTNEWRNISVAPGTTIAFMHFVAEQTGRNAAIQSAQRLVQLPAEALTGLTTEDITAIRNFAVPADLSSTVAPLPALNGSVRGRVLAADTTTVLPGSRVTVRSSNALFGRTFTSFTNGLGVFGFDPRPPDSGNPVSLPAESFTVQAVEPLTGVLSPAIGGNFATGLTDASQDIIFSNTGMLSGTVQRSGGSVVSAGSVTLTGVEVEGSIHRSIAVDGSFNYTGLLPGTYTLVGRAAGTSLTGVGTATISAGASSTTAIFIQSSGVVQGTVRRSTGEVSTGVAVNMIGGNFRATSYTDTAGNFIFNDVPLGTFSLETFEGVTNTAASAIVSVAQDQIVTQDLTLRVGGSVVGHISLSNGGNGIGVQVSLTHATGTLLAVSDVSGNYRVDNVPPGVFTIRALDPISLTRGITAGSLGLSGQTVTVNLSLFPAGTVTGTVFEANGTTPAIGRQVSINRYLYGYSNVTTTDGSGRFTFDLVPTGSFTLSALNIANGDRGQISNAVNANNETRTVNFNMNGLGSVVVTVRDASNNLIPNANVTWSGNGNFGGYRSNTTDANGVTTFADVFAGNFSLSATDPATLLGGSNVGTVAATAITNITVQLQPAGAVVGRVFLADGTTPAANTTVRVLSAFSVIRTTTADADGSYRFNAIPLGSYFVDALDSNGRVRAKESGVGLNFNGDLVTRNLTYSGLGNVGGTVRNADTTPQANIAVTVRSLNPTLGGFFSGNTDANGVYNITGVPVGGFAVSVLDFSRGVAGSTSGRIDNDGQDVIANIQLQSNVVSLGRTLFDTNDFRYDMQTNGSLSDGSRDAYDGAFNLIVTTGGVASNFTGASAGTIEDNDREVAIRQAGLAGLNVTRKIFVPTVGYFARYLEIFENPGAADVVIDVNVRSNLGSDGGTRIIATSSNDLIFNNSDFWLSTDDENGSSPFPNSDPSLSEVFAGPNARLATSTATISGDNLNYHWNGITVPAGQTVIIMHFAVQQFTQAASVASATRLIQLPPEALQGLGPDEIPNIMNFAVPADGVSILTPLQPPGSGSVNGRVFAGDGTTTVADAIVNFRSGNLYFGRNANVSTDANGAYNIINIPLDGFSLTARHPLTGVSSPSISGSFLGTETVAVRDIVFTNTGLMVGTVRRADGSLATAPNGGYLQLFGNNTNLYVNLRPDGTFPTITGLVPATYNLTAVIYHPQGTELRAVGTASVVAGQTTTFTLTLPAVGSVSGVVRSAAGVALANIYTEISDNSIYRYAYTDANGAFALVDLPPGPYSLRAYEPNSGVYTTIPATITANQNLVQDITLIGLGSVRVQVNFNNGTPVPNSVLYIREVARGSGFRYTGAVTDSTGVATIANVTVGDYTVRAYNPNNTSLFSDANGNLPADGATVNSTVTLAATGTVRGRVTRPNGAALASTYVELYSTTGSNGTTMPYQYAYIDSNGNYTLPRSVPVGVPFRLVAYSPVDGAHRRTLDNQQLTADGQDYVADLVLPATATLRVTVLRSDSTPFANARIEVRDAFRGLRNVGNTDTAGQLSVANIPEGDVFVQARDGSSLLFAGSSTRAILATDDGLTVDLTVNAPLSGSVTGRVYAADGLTPITSSYVELYDVASNQYISAVYTNTDGRYTFGPFATGAAGFLVRAYSPNFDLNVTATGTFTTEGEVITRDITLPVSVIRGAVFQNDGTTPVAFPDVFARQVATGVTYYATSSNTDGTYSIIGAPVGDYTLTVQDNDGVTGTATGSITDVAVPLVLNLTLGPAGTLTGTARSDTGELLQNVQVRIESTGGAYARTVLTNDSGVYSMSNVAAGNVFARVERNGFIGTGTASITTHGQTVTLDLTLPAPMSVNGVVFNTDGTTPVDAAFVEVRHFNTSNNGTALANFTTGPDGAYSFTGLPPGNLHLISFPSGSNSGGLTEVVSLPNETLTRNLVYGTGLRNGTGSFRLNLDGTDSFRYDVQCYGYLNDGGNVERTQGDAYDGAYELYVNSTFFSMCPNAVTAGNSGREVLIGSFPVSAFVRGSRKIFVPAAGGFARYQEVFTNTGTVDRTITVMIESNLGSDGDTFYTVTPTSTGNRYAVSFEEDDCCDPALAHVFNGTGARITPSSVQFTQYDDDLRYEWQVTIPAGQTVRILHFAVQRNTGDPAAAQTAAEALVDLSNPDALVGMTAAEKAQVLNFNIP